MDDSVLLVASKSKMMKTQIKSVKSVSVMFSSWDRPLKGLRFPEGVKCLNNRRVELLAIFSITINNSWFYSHHIPNHRLTITCVYSSLASDSCSIETILISRILVLVLMHLTSYFSYRVCQGIETLASATTLEQQH